MVAVLLRQAAIAIRCGPDILDVDVAFLMQFAQDAREAVERFPDVLGFFGLGIGFVGDFYVEVETGLALLAERDPADHPAVGLDEVDGNRRDAPFLFRMRLVSSSSSSEISRTSCGDLPALTLTLRMGMAFLL
jgi:hypothetical protein